jgi:acetyl-CoA acetyltransferase family protein
MHYRRTTVMTDSYIVDAVRTPVGRFGGALASVRPDDLAANVFAKLLERNATLDPQCIDDVFLGNSNGAGEENRNVARMALLLADYPVSVPGTTVNRLCGSGLEAVCQASRGIECRDYGVVIAGGVESMTRAPYVVQKSERPHPRENSTMYSTTLGWRMENKNMPAQWTVALGEGAEILVDEFLISRIEQDEFALLSHQRAQMAWERGLFDDEIVSVPNASINVDESIRFDSAIDKFSQLSPVFRTSGTVTAGNSSPLNDGAAALLLMSEIEAAKNNINPIARIAGRAVSGIEPHRYGLGPVEAAAKALRSAGITWSDLSIVELNEAFAAQALACLKSWPELDPKIVNPQGGAIAIGHPVGASGARILTTLSHALRRTGGGWGLATMCIGVGQGIAIVLDAR